MTKLILCFAPGKKYTRSDIDYRDHGWRAEKCPINKVTLGEPSRKNDPLREVHISDSSWKEEKREI